MTQTENQVDGDMFMDLHANSEVQTVAEKTPNPAHAFIKKTIHPPSAIPEYNGLPTNDARSQVLVKWRNMELMKTPAIFDVNKQNVRLVTPGDLDTFDMAFLVTNGMRVLSIAFINNATDNNILTQDLSNTMIQNLYDCGNLVNDAQLYRPVYKSTTMYLNATAFNDTGMCTAEQFNPNVLFAGTVLAFSDSKPRYFYNWCRDMIKCDRLSVISNEHPEFREYYGKWDDFLSVHRTECHKVCNIKPNETIKLDPNMLIQVISFGNSGLGAQVQLVPDNSQILQQSERSLGEKAKEGCFMVQRLNTIAPGWLTAGNTNRYAAGSYGLYQCYGYYPYAAGGVFQAFSENSIIGATTLSPLLDTLWSSDMTFGWIRFSGLALNPQAGNVTTQMLIKKTYTGYEVQPSIRSAWSGMVQISPKPDLSYASAHGRLLRIEGRHARSLQLLGHSGEIRGRWS